MTQEMPIGLLQESKTNPRRTFAGEKTETLTGAAAEA